MKLYAETPRNAGDGVAEAFLGASKKVSSLPGVGDELSSWFDQAAGSGRSMSSAGSSMVNGVDGLAFPLACAVALPPIFLVGCVWLWRRWHFVANVQAAQVFINDAADLDLFALRAMATQPMRELARIHPDPAGAWRAKDTAVIRSLATLALAGVNANRSAVVLAARCAGRLPPAHRSGCP